MKKERSSLSIELWARYRKSPMAMIGLVIFALILLGAIFADVITPYHMAIDMAGNRFELPSTAHLLGTDNYGRDILARILHGSRISIIMGIGSTVFGMLVGGIVGAVSAYKGGQTDNILMRLNDILLSIPPVLLALAIVASLGTGAINIIIAVSIASIPRFARLVRATVLTVVDEEYITAAHSYGASDARIIRSYILPNAFGPIMVQATMSVASMVLETSAMSFLGLGIKLPTPEWGAMLSEAGTYMRNAPHLLIFPGIAIVLFGVALNLMGDGLRDALDPKLRD